MGFDGRCVGFVSGKSNTLSRLKTSFSLSLICVLTVAKTSPDVWF